jgi:hypothetical protein
LGVRISLADLQQDVLPGTRWCKTQIFLYDEVVRLGSQ